MPRTFGWIFGIVRDVFATLAVLLGVLITLANVETLPDWFGHVVDNLGVGKGTLIIGLLVALGLSELGKRLCKRMEESYQQSIPEFTPQLRANLLDLLGARYAKRLNDSLRHEVRLQLGMKETPGALSRDSSLRLIGEREDRPVESGTSIEELFDESGGRLLILGEPGAGKTTMMLQLAQRLVERAVEEDREPVPVVVNLAAWAEHGGSLRQWLADDALQVAASVSRKLARTLVEDNRLLLLLDGLDEVKAAERAACINAINDYLSERAGQVVVCSRTQEYERTEERLALEKAVRIEPLDPDQFSQALEGIPETEGLRTMLRQDELLRELATTPLMMSVMLLAYGGKEPQSIQADTAAERRRALWDDYVTRMIARRPTDYAPENILRWLSWLGERMYQNDMTNFIPERMQPAWLERPSLFKWAVPLFFGLLGALSFGLLGALGVGLLGALGVGMIGALVNGLEGALLGALFGVLLLGLGVGLPTGLGIGLVKNTESIRLEEQVNWSLRKVFLNWNMTFIKGPLGGAVVGLTIFLMIMVIYGLINEMKGALFYSLVFGLPAVLVGGIHGLVYGLIEAGRSTSAVKESQNLGERLWNSRLNGLGYGLIYGLFVGLLLGLSGGLAYGFSYGFVYDLVGVLLLGLLFGLLVSLIVALFTHGGGEALKYDLLCFFFFFEGSIPWWYFRFLGDAADLLLLQQVGGAVHFRHLLLRNYFADLTPERIESLATQIGDQRS